MKIRFLSLLFVLVFLLLWEFSTKDSLVFPSVSAVFNAFVELLEDNILFTAIVDSLLRFFVGLFLGGILAIFLGFILGYFNKLELLFEPFIQLLRPISPIAWLPLIVLIFGIGEVGAIFVISIAVFFPLLALCIAGVRQINPTLLAMASNLGASRLLVFKNIIIPGAFLHISTGLKLAASIAWINLVAAEMLGIQSGLGYLIIDGRNLLRTDMILVAILIIGILGYILHLFFSYLEKFILKKLGGSL